MNKYNVLIIGAGGQGAVADAPGSQDENKIISYAHAFKDHNGFRLLGFKDSDMHKAAEAAIAWKTDYWSTWAGAIESYIVVVSTPDNTHYEILKQLANYPLKLVICEKPICSDLQQAKEIVELYKSKGIPLMCDYTRRFIPELQTLKQYGLPELAICEFNRGFLHSGSHAVDMFNMLEAKNIRLIEVPLESERIWKINLYWKDRHWQEKRIGDDPVPSYYDMHMKYVVENVYNFLEGKEELKCTGEMALKSLEMCFKLMEGANY
jgi:hypothetical protein